MSNNERRRRRSHRTNEALELLLEAVKERSDISSIAIVDGRGLVLAGSGAEHELMILGTVAAPAASGAFDASCEKLTEGTDVMSCPLAIGERKMYLAALGDRVSRMPDAVRGVTRILKTG
jgi:hypothetical protein